MSRDGMRDSLSRWERAGVRGKGLLENPMSQMKETSLARYLTFVVNFTHGRVGHSTAPGANQMPPLHFTRIEPSCSSHAAKSKLCQIGAICFSSFQFPCGSLQFVSERCGLLHLVAACCT